MAAQTDMKEENIIRILCMLRSYLEQKKYSGTLQDMAHQYAKDELEMEHPQVEIQLSPAKESN